MEQPKSVVEFSNDEQITRLIEEKRKEILVAQNRLAKVKAAFIKLEDDLDRAKEKNRTRKTWVGRVGYTYVAIGGLMTALAMTGNLKVLPVSWSKALGKYALLPFTVVVFIGTTAYLKIPSKKVERLGYAVEEGLGMITSAELVLKSKQKELDDLQERLRH